MLSLNISSAYSIIIFAFAKIMLVLFLGFSNVRKQKGDQSWLEAVRSIGSNKPNLCLYL